MKRCLLSLIIFLSIVASMRAETNDAKPWFHSGVTVAIGPGIFNRRPWMQQGFAYCADLGYRLNIARGFSWQIVKASGAYSLNDGRYMIGAYSGIRYDSPQIPTLFNNSLYANIDFGVAYQKEDVHITVFRNTQPFAWDAVVGVKLHRNCSVGVYLKPNYGEIAKQYYSNFQKYTSLLGGIQFEYIF